MKDEKKSVFPEVDFNLSDSWYEFDTYVRAKDEDGFWRYVHVNVMGDSSYYSKEEFVSSCFKDVYKVCNSNVNDRLCALQVSEGERKELYKKLGKGIVTEWRITMYIDVDNSGGCIYDKDSMDIWFT